MPSIFDLEAWIGHNRVLATVLFTVLVIAVRMLLERAIRKRRGILRDTDRRWISRVRRTSVLIILLVLVIAWLPQIQHLALSIAAVAVAVVVATKELLLCLLGALMRGTTRVFSIGDWVRIGEQFGEVIEENLFTTVMLEVDRERYHYTGRSISVPNSVLLSSPITNQNFLKRYVFHRFSYIIEPVPGLVARRSELLAAVNLIVAPFAELANRYNAMLERRSGVDIPSADAMVEITTNEQAKLVVSVRVFCPTAQFDAIEAAITAAVFAWAERKAEQVARATDVAAPSAPT